MDFNVSLHTNESEEQNKNCKSRELSKNRPSSICSSSKGIFISSEPDAQIELVSTNKEESPSSVFKKVIDQNSSFVQCYFDKHSNSLPLKLTLNSRRLSQCREEDEEQEKKDLVPSNMSTMSSSDKSPPQLSGSEFSVIDTISGPIHKFVITKTNIEETNIEETNNDIKKELSEAAKLFTSKKQYVQANTVHAISSYDPKKPSISAIFKSPLQSLHYDTKFFDSSLIEMKSNSSSTVDHGSAEDIWVRRKDIELNQGIKSSESPILFSKDDSYIPRPKSGTWTSHSQQDQNLSKDVRDNRWDLKKKKENQFDSGSNSPDIKRSNDPSASKLFRKRSNSDAGKRKASTFMTSMKNAMMHTGLIQAKKAPRDGSAHPVQDDESDTRYYHTITATASTSRSPMTKVMDIFRKPHTPSPLILYEDEKKDKKKEKQSGFVHSRPKAPRDGSAHPVRDSGSDTQYYHTVTAASSNRSPMTKVMDIFRNRSHVSVSPEDRKKEE